MSAVAQLMPHIGLSRACRAFMLNRGLVYRDRHRRRASVSRVVPRGRARPPLAFSIPEQQLLLGLLGSERFVDMAPAAVFATLLDEGRYCGSIRTMYRLLAAALYVILDIYSRYVVGWMVAYRETAELAEQLIADTIGKQNIVPGTLTLHADRGTSMRSKPVAALRAAPSRSMPPSLFHSH